MLDAEGGEIAVEAMLIDDRADGPLEDEPTADGLVCEDSVSEAIVSEERVGEEVAAEKIVVLNIFVAALPGDELFKASPFNMNDPSFLSQHGCPMPAPFPQQ